MKFKFTVWPIYTFTATRTTATSANRLVAVFLKLDKYEIKLSLLVFLFQLFLESSVNWQHFKEGRSLEGIEHDLLHLKKLNSVWNIWRLDFDDPSQQNGFPAVIGIGADAPESKHWWWRWRWRLEWWVMRERRWSGGGWLHESICKGEWQMLSEI